MYNNSKRTSKVFSAFNFVAIFFTPLLVGCALFSDAPSAIPLSERGVVFEKAKALMAANQYAKAEPFFLSLTAEPEEKSDAIYDLSLWNSSLIYEKLGYPEKSILALQLLLDRNTTHVMHFKIKASLIKNYFRVENKLAAMKYKKMLDEENPKTKYDSETLYLSLLQTLNLNFDHLILEELEYIGEIQKYLLFVMEQNQSKMNQHATELLISLYERAYEITLKDSVAASFKEKIMISILDKLRQFDLYKMGDTNINLKTVAKMTLFSQKLEKKITERLHQ